MCIIFSVCLISFANLLTIILHVRAVVRSFQFIQSTGTSAQAYVYMLEKEWYFDFDDVVENRTDKEFRADEEVHNKGSEDGSDGSENGCESGSDNGSEDRSERDDYSDDSEDDGSSEQSEEDSEEDYSE